MSHDPDYLLALEIQKRWNAEHSQNSDDDEPSMVDFKMPAPSKKPMRVKLSNPRSNLDEEFLNRTQNLVHPEWEVLDPTPDAKSLFNAFDQKFFQNRLNCVTLEWSKRMYSCAGICYSRRNRYGQEVTIRLSEPLLKLRPRKDLVETMLHEMIHAYCFVLNIREGNGGHGPNFKKIMYGINKVAGTNITVFHTFHDEVELYKQHWWRCNGSCQHRAPFFGYVKRTSNRAPSSNDQWWAVHQENCGGSFLKIKGPDLPEKPMRKTKTAPGADLRKFFKPTETKKPNINGFSDIKGTTKGPIKSNGGGTLLLNPKSKTPNNQTAKPTPAPAASIAKAFPPSSYPGLSSDPFNVSTPTRGGSLQNVRGLRDLNNALGGSGAGAGGGGNSGHVMSKSNTTPKSYTMQGQGYSLESSAPREATASSLVRSGAEVNRNHLRDVWSKRFGGVNKPKGTEKSSESINQRLNVPAVEGDAKRRRLSDDVFVIPDDEKDTQNGWEEVDDEIMIRAVPTETIAILSDDDDDDDDDYAVEPVTRPKPMTDIERTQAIKQEILDESIDLKDEDLILIDDEYNDDNERSQSWPVLADLANHAVVDEFFGEDTLFEDFKRENDVVPTGSRYIHNAANDIVTCPICQSKMKRSDFGEHLNGCTGIVVKIKPHANALKKLLSPPRASKPIRKPRIDKRKSVKDILQRAGYTEDDLRNVLISSQEYLSNSSSSSSPSPPAANSTVVTPRISAVVEDSPPRDRRKISMSTIQCPNCGQDVEREEINNHLDDCLDN